MTLSSTGARQKPALDENSFQQLLAAAYVMQQHNDSLNIENLGSPRSQALSVVAEIQGQIRTRNLNVAAASALIADQLLTMTRANSVSISLITDGYLDCVAESGVPSKVPGSCVSSHSIVATERLKAGGIFESENAQSDMRLDVGLCRTVGVGSLIAAPVLRFGEIAGLIEIRWNQPAAFAEADLRTCRLMAGLTTGSLERSVRIGKAQAFRDDGLSAPVPFSPRPASEEANVTTAPVAEAAPPQISETAKSANVSDPDVERQQISEERAELKTPPQVEASPTCRVCGRPFTASEAFCGFCSMPRAAGSPPDDLQSKWASMWYIQRAQGALEDVEKNTFDVGTKRDVPESPPSFARIPVNVENAAHETPLTRALQSRPQALDTRVPVLHTSPVSETLPFEVGPITASTKRIFQTLQKRWRDELLAVVAVSLALALASAWPKNDSQLTWFQSLMVRVGVSRGVAQAPVFSGRPDARVWLDVHTTLYYCEGSDMYGKTPDGNFTSQHDAQRSGFESATGAACR